MKLVNVKTNEEFRLTKYSREFLPKKDPSVQVTIDDLPSAVIVTNNAAWSGEASPLYYPYFQVYGAVYYATLTAEDYQSFPDGHYQIQEGTAKRVDPKRVTSETAREAARIAKFQTTFQARTKAQAQAQAEAEVEAQA